MSRNFFVLLCSSIVVLIGGVAYAQYSQVGGRYDPGTWDAYEGSQLIGYLVKSPDGSTLGQISDLVIDEANHKVALVLLSDVPGAGDNLIAVPYAALHKAGGSSFEVQFGDMEARIGPTSGYGDTYVRMMEALPGDLFGVPSAIEPSWVDFVHLAYGRRGYSAEKGVLPTEEDFARFSAVIGADVQLFETAARVDDLVINFPDGQIAFVSISGIPGREAAAVPYSFLTRSGDNLFVLNATEEELAEAPTFKAERDFGNRTWAEVIYRYFGTQPYWTD